MPRDLVWARVRHASLLDLESHKKEPDAGDHFHVGLASSRGGGSSAKTGTRVFHSARRSKGSARRRFDANTIRHSAKGRARHACATRRARFLGRKKQRLGGPLRRRLEASARPRFGANTIPQKRARRELRLRVGLASCRGKRRGMMDHNAPPRRISYACFGCNYSLSAVARLPRVLDGLFGQHPVSLPF
jgi:hypothetical protein